MKTCPHRTHLIGGMLLMFLCVSSTSGQESINNERKFTLKPNLALMPAATPTSRSSSPETEGVQKGDNEWGIWGGIAFDSPTWIGTTRDARFGHIGLRYGRVLKTSKTVAFEWTIDVVPVAFLSNSRFFTALPPAGGVFVFPRVGAYGAGAAPIGLKFNFRRNKRVQPFGQATGGFLYFNKQVPEVATSQFNFTFDFSGGVQVVNSNRRSYTIGYKFHHISNGNTGFYNPGVDLQMIFFGVSVFK